MERIYSTQRGLTLAPLHRCLGEDSEDVREDVGVLPPGGVGLVPDRRSSLGQQPRSRGVLASAAQALTLHQFATV